jgi:hypothetical protein
MERMRFITTQICDNPNGDVYCQNEELTAYLIIEPLAGWGTELHYCEDCAESIVPEFMENEEAYPRLTEKDEGGYEVRYGKKKVDSGKGYMETDWAERIYYSKEIGDKLCSDIEDEGYCAKGA